MKENKSATNPLLCDPSTGFCAIPNTGNEGKPVSPDASQEKPIKIVYFTDPICSSCWGIEPQLRKLKLAFGDFIAIEYRMGGLLPDWSYNNGGISEPKDVAKHWDEVSLYYDMPIDGDVWLEDPLDSSYPPSIAFKAAQMQSQSKAILFLRVIRELVFLHKQNITNWSVLESAAELVGLDPVQLKKDYESGARQKFEADLKLAREYGVRGFPSMYFTDRAGRQVTVYGSNLYDVYVKAILKLHEAATPANYDQDWKSLFKKHYSMTALEFATLSGLDRKKAEMLLNELSAKGSLTKFTTKNGSIWRLKNI